MRRVAPGNWLAGRIAISGLACVSSLIGQAAPSALEIIQRSLRADNDNIHLASRYTYREQEVTKELDSSGHIKSTKSVLKELLFLGGKQYGHVIEKDGKPLPPVEARKEQAKLDKETAEASRLSNEEREKRFARYEREQEKDRARGKDIPEAYDFKLLGDAQLGGRNVYLIEAAPRDSYHGQYRNLYRNLRGKVWIDKSDYEWVRVEAEVLNDISFGLFLAKVSRGARMTFEQTRINNEVWLPKSITLRAAARALIKHYNVDEQLTYSDYRKFQSDSRIVSVESAESK